MAGRRLIPRFPRYYGRSRRVLLTSFLGGAEESDYTGSTMVASTYALTANGIATTTLTATVYRDGALAAAEDVTFTVERVQVGAATSQVIVNPSTIDNDGADSTFIGVTALTTDSRPLPGIPGASVVVALTGTGNTVTQPAAATDQTGYVTGSAVSTNAATKTASATIAGQAITDTASLVVQAAVPPTTYASSTFVGGTIAPFTNPWGDRVTVIADPTSSGRGNVVQILYAPSSGGSQERAMIWTPSPEISYNREIWFKGDVYIKDTSGSDPDWNDNHNRKLIDWQGTATRLTLNRRDGVLRISIVDRSSGTETEVIAETTGITILKDTWYTLEVRMVTNTANGVADGIVQIYVNGSLTPSYTRTTGISWITTNGGALTSFTNFLVGMQLTIDSGDPVYEDTRYWDNVYFSDGRL